MTQILRYAAKSDVGMVRKENEDAGYAGRSLLIVADGMGGHAAGELASSTVVATLAELDSEELPAGDVLTALDDAMLTSAERIAQFIGADPKRAGMGTTLTAIYWRGGRIALIHVGDSRAYLLRGGQLSQITHDHTYVQTLIDAGRITAEQARSHPKRNLLLRAIDGTGTPEGETSMREARVGDRFLLCSDGLSGVVTDPMLESVLRQVSDPTAAVTELVDLALAGGAPDNVTAVVADVVEVDEAGADLESARGRPVVVGAAGEQRNRAALPGLRFPDDVGPAGGDSTQGGISGPTVAGGLAARGSDRSRGGAPDSARDLSRAEVVGDEVDTGELPAVDAQADETDESGGPVTPGGPGPATPAQPGSIGAAVASGAIGVGSDGPSAASDEDEDAQPGAGPGWARRHWRGLVSAATVLVVLLVGLAGFLWWLSAQWYVGVSSGYVAIHQGIAQQVGGVELNRVSSTSGISLSTLPYYDQAQVERTIDAGTQSEAQRIVALLAVKAAGCASPQAPLGCPPAPTPLPLSPTQPDSPVSTGPGTTSTPNPVPNSTIGPAT